MNFKADWSFLEKISMGAVSSKQVIKLLNDAGHDVIELERYSTSNKIWATKIKRLRIPDLICLKCGRRIESRAKSKLEIKMSDNEKNSDRRWDAGLRDEDLIAFIKCRAHNGEWIPGEDVNLFSVESLKQAYSDSKTGKTKPAYEGAEKDRTWPSSTPSKDGTIDKIIRKNGKLQIKVRYVDGRNYCFSIKEEKHYNSYCEEGDTFIGGETIIAGVPPQKERIDACNAGYDFLNDIKSDVKEIRYAGVKVLGYLDKKPEYINEVMKLKNIEIDYRIQLEIYSSLIRLGVDVWDEFCEFAMSDIEDEYRLEFVLILGELEKEKRVSKILHNIAVKKGFKDELRAAAAWGIKVDDTTLPSLIEIAKSEVDTVASHALAHIIDNFEDEYTSDLVKLINDDCSGGIVLKILTEADVVKAETLVDIYRALTDNLQKKWVAMSIGFSGKKKYGIWEDTIEKVDIQNFSIIKELWDYSTSSIDAEKSSEIIFLRKQCL